jgi:hypothetical protein|nr:MAG TPA: hypothetical protein [Caudoviricetes sp.]
MSELRKGRMKMKKAKKQQDVEDILSIIVSRIFIRLIEGETFGEIAGAGYIYDNMVNLLCGIYKLTFEETKEVMERWKFDSVFRDWKERFGNADDKRLHDCR